MAYFDGVYALSKSSDFVYFARAAIFDINFTMQLNESKGGLKRSRFAKRRNLYLGYLYRTCLRSCRFLEKNSSDLNTAIALTNQLRKQHDSLLLRGSLHFKMQNLQRSLNPQGLEEQFEAINKQLLDGIRKLRSNERELDFDWDSLAIPLEKKWTWNP